MGVGRVPSRIGIVLIPAADLAAKRRCVRLGQAHRKSRVDPADEVG